MCVKNLPLSWMPMIFTSFNSPARLHFGSRKYGLDCSLHNQPYTPILLLVNGFIITCLKPQLRWFCHFDDDIYVNTRRLLEVLSMYNPSHKLYLGRWPHNINSVVHIRREKTANLLNIVSWQCGLVYEMT